MATSETFPAGSGLQGASAASHAEGGVCAGRHPSDIVDLCSYHEVELGGQRTRRSRTGTAEAALSSAGTGISAVRGSARVVAGAGADAAMQGAVA